MSATAILPTVLGFMQHHLPCPDDVRARIASLHIVEEEGTGGLSNPTVAKWARTDSKPSAFSQNRGYSGRGRGGYGAQTITDGTRGRGRGRGAFVFRGTRGGHFSTAPRFGNRARTDVTVEERMMDRIRDRMNKFCESTYETTKSWLSELLDSGETDFLKGFITLVFDKASEESHICPLYAKLISELRTRFSHLDVELHRIYEEFLHVFDEKENEKESVSEPESSEYDAYVVLRRRRQLRKGYAAFVAEIASLEALSEKEILSTCNHIINGILDQCDATKEDKKNNLIEEYADCLKILAIRCNSLLTRSDLLKRIGEVRAKSEISNKARFALMDIEDALA